MLREVTEGDRKGGSDKKGGKRTDFDSEMVQEQQQEEEKQKEQEQEQQAQVEHDNAPREDRPWMLANLSTARLSEKEQLGPKRAADLEGGSSGGGAPSAPFPFLTCSL